MKNTIVFILFSLFMLCDSYSQDLVDDISTGGIIGDEAQIFTEQVRIISHSKKIFILTNTNQQLNKGDFITLIVNDKDAACRAIVAKNHDSLVGIKILKIYSLANWSKIRKGKDVKILKGDDTILFTKKNEDKSEEQEDKIKSEEDLYAEELAINNELNGDFESDKRLIKPDNIVSAAYGQIRFTSSINDNKEYAGHLISGGWAYQFQDNFWLEGLISYASIKDYPTVTNQTVVNPLTARIKYTLKAPFYSYLMPYVGFQVNNVDSPAATEQDQKNEIQQKLAGTEVAIGVTILKRLVPGWFAKADIGTDMINIGAAVEF
ncbi:MAG: autotransporter outer membrane beta-barrel domain-containing protein [Bacteriovoracaceae bacterium]|jgi:hypothetical protein|nr:autotransporter outer membrane beta-barrel domain-containing protein [Bacteriovoracaceae bacterium]